MGVPSLPHHQCHDYAALAARWRDLAKRTGLKVNELCRVEGQRVLWLESAAARAGQPVIYLSAGIHGDEAGATSGLLHWAEANEARLGAEAFMIFPCLNPVGLQINTRVDGRGLDLNRRFHLEDDPVCGAWLRVMRERSVRLGICLHEDYDAQGIYVYELSRLPKGWSGEILERITTARMPVDARRRIEGRAAVAGVIQRRRSPQGLPGLPEAVALYQLGCQVSLTFETPSEFALQDRVQAQADFLETALEWQRGW
jgi:hypothetical protein